MGRPAHSDLLARYRQKITYAKKWRRDEGYDDCWRRLIEVYRGRHYEYMTEEDRMLVNISFSTVNVIAPSVAVNHPKIAVNAVKPEAAPMAIITEAVVNYWWRHYDVRPEFRTAVKDYLIVGHGWMKTGYRFVEETEEAPQSEQMEPQEQEMEGGEADPEAAGVESNTVIVEDRPFAERVSPFDVFVDPDCTSERDMGWIAQRIRRSLKDVKEDKRYNAEARRDCAPSSWRKFEGDAPMSLHDEVRDKEEQYVEVWEFYDLRKRTLCVFASGGEKFLIAPRPMPYAFGHPFVMIRNYDVPDYFYPIGDLEAIEPLQRELNETRSQMMNHRKKFARKWLFRESSFDQTGRNLLQSDEDNVMVPVQGDEQLQNTVFPMPAQISPPDFYNQSQLIASDIETVSGVSEYMRGSMPEIRRTATEASIVADAGNARSADKLAQIELAISRVASRLVQLAQQFMSSEQVARVVGKNGQPVWVTFDVDYIQGEFDFEVESGSTAPNNESFRRQSALQMVDAMAPFVQMGVVDMRKLAAHVLQFGFDVKDPEGFMVPPAPPGMMPMGGEAQAGMPQGGAPPGMGEPGDASLPPPPMGG
jgi:hypothetical protein